MDFWALKVAKFLRKQRGPRCFHTFEINFKDKFDLNINQLQEIGPLVHCSLLCWDKYVFSLSPAPPKKELEINLPVSGGGEWFDALLKRHNFRFQNLRSRCITGNPHNNLQQLDNWTDVSWGSARNVETVKKGHVLSWWWGSIVFRFLSPSWCGLIGHFGWYPLSVVRNLLTWEAQPPKMVTPYLEIDMAVGKPIKSLFNPPSTRDKTSKFGYLNI